MSSRQLYSPSDVNLELILKMIMEHCPGWIIDETRKECIKDAIETKDLEFLRILAQTVHPFINTCEYLELAVGIEDNIPIIEYLLSLNCPIDQVKVLSSAARNKALNNFEFLHQKKRFPIADTCRVFSSAAGTEDNIEIMEYVVSHSRPISRFILSKSAAENGAFNNLKWLLKNGFLKRDERIFEAAMRSGSLDILKWLKGNECPIDKGFRFYIMENCSIKTIEWLTIEQGVTMNPTLVFMGAAKHGCLDKMKWLLKKKYSVNDSQIFQLAAEHGSLGNLKWLLKNGCRINDPFILAAAARQGHFDIMKWLLENNCPINGSWILVAAAEFGSIKQMEWLLDNKCLIDNNPSIFEKAAEKGNVELMEWLLKKGCPIDRAMYGAVQHGCLTIMKWLFEKGCPIDDPVIMKLAIKYGSIRNLNWLLEKGCPIDDSRFFVRAAEHDSLDVMKWLLDNGCPIDDPNIMIKAAEYGSLVKMKWLLKNGCSIDSPRIFSEALFYGSLRNLKWLLENQCPVDEEAKSNAIEMFCSFELLLQLLEVDPAIVVYQ